MNSVSRRLIWRATCASDETVRVKLTRRGCLLTPADVHHGLAEQRVVARTAVLTEAYTAHPERFPADLPRPPARPVEVWINRPKARATEKASISIPAGSAILDPLSASSYVWSTLGVARN